jgi:hypothetical protein
MVLLWISGSLRQGFYNSALLDAAGAECPRDAELVVRRGLVVAGAHQAFTADGRLRDAHLAKTLSEIVGDLTRQALQEAA